MRKLFPVLILIISSFTLQAQSVNKLKKELLNSLEQKSTALISISDNIWEAAEVAFRETKSAEYLIEYAEQNGLTVEKGLAWMPTAFTATYGERNL